MKIKKLNLGKKLLSIVTAGFIMINGMPALADTTMNWGTLEESMSKEDDYTAGDTLAAIFTNELGLEEDWDNGFVRSIDVDYVEYTFGAKNYLNCVNLSKRISALMESYGLEYNIEIEGYDFYDNGCHIESLNMSGLTEEEIASYGDIKFQLTEYQGNNPKEETPLFSVTPDGESDKVTVKLVFPNMEKYPNNIPYGFWTFSSNTGYMDQLMGYVGGLDINRTDKGFKNLEYTYRLIPGYTDYENSERTVPREYASNITSPVLAARIAENLNSTGKYTAFVTKEIVSDNSGHDDSSRGDYNFVVSKKGEDPIVYLNSLGIQGNCTTTTELLLPNGKITEREYTLDSYNVRLLPRISYSSDSSKDTMLNDAKNIEWLDPITVKKGTNKVNEVFDYDPSNLYLYWIDASRPGNFYFDRTNLLENGPFTIELDQMCVNINDPNTEDLAALYIRANITSKEAANLYIQGMKDSPALSNVSLKASKAGTTSTLYGSFTFTAGTGLFVGMDAKTSQKKAKEYVENWAKSHIDRIDYDLQIRDLGDNNYAVDVYLVTTKYKVSGSYKSKTTTLRPVKYYKYDYDADDLTFHQAVLTETGFNITEYRELFNQVVYSVIYYLNEDMKSEYADDALVEYTITYTRDKEVPTYTAVFGDYNAYPWNYGSNRIYLRVPYEKTKTK